MQLVKGGNGQQIHGIHIQSVKYVSSQKIQMMETAARLFMN